MKVRAAAVAPGAKKFAEKLAFVGTAPKGALKIKAASGIAKAMP
ncbi:MAG: hypothetical protein WB566_09005 [Terriglobales bacterium]